MAKLLLKVLDKPDTNNLPEESKKSKKLKKRTNTNIEEIMEAKNKKPSGGEAILKGGFRAEFIRDGVYVGKVFIPLKELHKIEELICKNPEKELMFVLLGREVREGDGSQLYIQRIKELHYVKCLGGGVDFITTGSKTTEKEVKQIKEITGLEILGYGHSHRKAGMDGFSPEDKDMVTKFRGTGRNHVHLLAKLNKNGSVNVHVINNNLEKITLEMKAPVFIKGNGGNGIPKGYKFGTPPKKSLLKRLLHFF